MLNAKEAIDLIEILRLGVFRGFYLPLYISTLKIVHEAVNSVIYDLARQAFSLLLATILASAKYIDGKKYCIFQIENVGPPLLSVFSVVSK